ncbi:MAG: isocitrate lyase/PEP mutase family protein [Acidimicrobiales bacterium]
MSAGGRGESTGRAASGRAVVERRRARFLDLHVPGQPLLMPNAWDAGSARLLEAMGFQALATTSGGFAASRGRLDGQMGRDDVLAHAGDIAATVSVPVSADTENGFAHDPVGVAATVTTMVNRGLAGCSIEDHTGDEDDPIYDIGLARDRVAAAADAAHRGTSHLVVTARAENHLFGRRDLRDTIARLQAYQEAGADVLFAPGIRSLGEIRTLVSAVDRPVNVLALPGVPAVGELALAGVARVSVGAAFVYAAYAGLVDAASELRDEGTFGYWDRVTGVRPTIQEAFDR